MVLYWDTVQKVGEMRNLEQIPLEGLTCGLYYNLLKTLLVRYPRYNIAEIILILSTS